MDAFIKPTIGRIVLHRGADGETRPAIVTHVWSERCINLNVFPKDRADAIQGPMTSVTHADPEQEPYTRNSWHWMPYQKQVAAGLIAPVLHSDPNASNKA